MKYLLITFLLASCGFTPFPPSSPPADSITNKGGLLTSDGSAQSEFSPCADDEIIVWDSAQTLGFKCEAKPSGGGGGPTVVLGANYVGGTVSTSSSFQSYVSVTVTTTGAPVQLSVEPATSGFVSGLRIQTFTNRSCEIRWVRNGASFHAPWDISGTSGEYTNQVPVQIHDQPAAGTYTYTLQIRSSFNGCSYSPLNIRAVAKAY